jgi:peptidoglycan/LPS O-acetylase OafA/YrhL
MNRKPGLDLIRLAAIVAVLGAHLDLIEGFGYLGVDVFFVLSGWLIGGACMRGDLSVVDFWKRRWLRTLPAYLAFILFALAIGRLPASDTLSYPLFLENYVRPRPGFGLGQLWSLCVEEHFYILLPLILLLPKPARLAAFGLALVGCPLIRAVAFFGATRGWDVFDFAYVATHARLDGLAFGVGAAALSRSRAWASIVVRRHWLAVGGVAFLFVACISPNWFESRSILNGSLKFSIASLGTAMLIPLAVSVTAPSWLASRLAIASDYVYSIYLVHTLVIEFVTSRVVSGEVERIGVSLALTFIAAWLLRTWIERPFLQLRDRKRSQVSIQWGVYA